MFVNFSRWKESLWQLQSVPTKCDHRRAVELPEDARGAKPIQFLDTATEFGWCWRYGCTTSADWIWRIGEVPANGLYIDDRQRAAVGLVLYYNEAICCLMYWSLVCSTKKTHWVRWAMHLNGEDITLWTRLMLGWRLLWPGFQDFWQILLSEKPLKTVRFELFVFLQNP